MHLPSWLARCIQGPWLCIALNVIGFGLVVAYMLTTIFELTAAVHLEKLRARDISIPITNVVLPTPIVSEIASAGAGVISAATSVLAQVTQVPHVEVNITGTLMQLDFVGSQKHNLEDHNIVAFSVFSICIHVVVFAWLLVAEWRKLKSPIHCVLVLALINSAWAVALLDLILAIVLHKLANWRGLSDSVFSIQSSTGPAYTLAVSYFGCTTILLICQACHCWRVFKVAESSDVFPAEMKKAQFARRVTIERSRPLSGQTLSEP